MTYQGNKDDSGSDWVDDGKGFRAIMFWTDLKNISEFIPKSEQGL